MAHTLSSCTGLGDVPLVRNTGPSESEMIARTKAAIAQAGQKYHNKGAQNIDAFFRGDAFTYRTTKGDLTTNIIDQKEKSTYAFSDDMIRRMFSHLDYGRNNGTISHISERQGASPDDKCGIMIDYDIETTHEKPVLTERHYRKITSALVSVLRRDLNFGKVEEAKVHVFFIVKPHTVLVDASSEVPTYRYGFHILVPGIKVNRQYKRSLIAKFRANSSVGTVLREIGVIGDVASALDMNSASVPILFLGSCKNGGTPYNLGASLECSIEISDDEYPAPIMVQLLPDEVTAKYNMVAELSVMIEAEYSEFSPLVEMIDYVANDAAVLEDGADDSGDSLFIRNDAVSELIISNAEASQVHSLLGVLTPNYCSDYALWRNVIFMLVHTDITFKPLAIAFSQRCPEKWAAGGASALDTLWDSAVLSRSAIEHPITINSLHQWARTSDYEKYVAVLKGSHFELLLGYVHDTRGALGHYMFAQALQKMVGSRFCVDIDPTGRSAAAYTWYEFVTPGIQMIPGEVWKWRKEASPDTIQMYISEELAIATNKISIYLDECKSKADSEELVKYYKILETNFNRTKLKLYDDGFKAAIIRQCSPLFRKRGFSDKLDTVPFLFGTANGVLQLDRTCTLIDHFHEYPVSIFSPVAYHKFNPDSPGPWHQIILDAVADIIAEPDARDWILFHAAQCLSGCPKEGLMLLWEGGGQNGKTSFLRWVAKALGPRADKFNIQLMCSEREDADRPNSAMMKFKHLTYAYSEESNKSQVLNVARMKEMVNPGEVSGRDLNSRQETFTMKANLVAASQYSFIINTTDHGTWRRLCHYTSKRKFRRDPDPNNEFEKKDDHRFVREYPDNPEFQSAFLSILVHYYERLQNEYGGELKAVNSPTISGESEKFRRGQDTLHRWLSQFVMMSPTRGEEIPVAGLSAKYMEWYSMHIQKTKNNAAALSACEIIKEIESSAISKHLRPAANGVMMLRGCRILPPDDNTIYPDEKSLVAADLPRPDAPTSRDDGLNWWEARSVKPTAKPTTVNLEDEYKPAPVAYKTPMYKKAASARDTEAAKADDLLDAYFDSLESDDTMGGIYADKDSLMSSISAAAPAELESVDHTDA